MRLRSSVRTAAFVVLTGCFEDPPPVVEATSEGSATADTSTSTEATTTSSSTSSVASTLGEAEAGSAEAGSAGSGPEESSTAPDIVCGDEILDDGEMCDSTPGCDDMCRFTDYTCNPLNDAGCQPPLRCGLFDFMTETFACMPAGPGGVGGECCEANELCAPFFPMPMYLGLEHLGFCSSR